MLMIRRLLSRNVSLTRFPIVQIQRLEFCDNSDKIKKVILAEADIEESFIKGGGPGGQSVNKSTNCVQLIHKLTGIVVKAHESRSLLVNREKAREKLKLQLDLYYNGKLSKLAQEEAQSIEHKQKKKRRAQRRLLLKKAFKEDRKNTRCVDGEDK